MAIFVSRSLHRKWLAGLVSKMILLMRKGPGTLLIPGWSVQSVNGTKILKPCLFVCLLAFFRSIFFLLGRFSGNRFSFCFLLLVLYLSIVMFCTQVFIIVFDQNYLLFKYCSWKKTMEFATLTYAFSLRLCNVYWILDRIFERSFAFSVRFSLVLLGRGVSKTRVGMEPGTGIGVYFFLKNAVLG